MDIGAAIKEIRIKSLMSQNDFAHELGVSFSTVNRWEKGRAIPLYSITCLFARVFCRTLHGYFTVEVPLIDSKVLTRSNYK